MHFRVRSSNETRHFSLEGPLARDSSHEREREREKEREREREREIFPRSSDAALVTRRARPTRASRCGASRRLRQFQSVASCLGFGHQTRASSQTAFRSLATTDARSGKSHRETRRVRALEIVLSSRDSSCTRSVSKFHSYSSRISAVSSLQVGRSRVLSKSHRRRATTFRALDRPKHETCSTTLSKLDGKKEGGGRRRVGADAAELTHQRPPSLQRILCF